MPIEQMRSLSLLIFGAVTGSWISGDFEAHQWMVYMGILLPLWTPLGLDRIRSWPIWSAMVYVTIIGFGFSQYAGMPLKHPLFFLILTCVIYEIYGETRSYAPPRLLGLLSFLFLVAQIRSEFSLDKFFCIAVYNIGLIGALVTFHRGGIKLGASYSEVFREFGTSALHLVMITMLGINIFWLLPRFSDDSNAVMADFYDKSLSGFGSTVDLNDISSLKTQSQHIMDVTPAPKQGIHSRYIRGRVLEVYDDGVWSNANAFTTYLGNERTERFERLPASAESKRFEYTIDLDATQERILFFFDSFVAIEGPIFPMAIDGGGSDIRKIRYDRGYGTALSYKVTATNEHLPSNLDNPDVYLRMPRHMNYLREYADQVLGSEALSPQAAAQLIETHFQSTYTYSLDINNQGQSDPIQHFIQTRKGHCELFASTMALMLRTRGIPTRLALGFLLPRKNQVSDFYYVTTAEAHAWVEVYDGTRWRAYDPTAPNELDLVNLWVKDRMEYLKWLFRRSIVTYDQEKQLALFKEMPQFFYRHRGSIGFCLAVILLSAMCVVGYRRFMWATSPQQLPYRVQALIGKLEDRFGKRDVDERMADYLERIELTPEQQQAYMRFFSSYQHWRFARSSEQQVRQLYAQVRQIERELIASH